MRCGVSKMVLKVAVLAVLVAGFADYNVGIARAAEAPGKSPIRVQMVGKKFVPEHLIIKAGDVVIWVNESDGRTHQVTTDPGQAVDVRNVSSPKGAPTFDSRDIHAGETYRHQFTVPGIYRYSCPPHELSGMIGTIDVQR